MEASVEKWQKIWKANFGDYERDLATLIQTTPVSFDTNLRKSLPKEGGVYRIFDTNNVWSSSSYVGKTKQIKARVAGDHYKGNRTGSTLRNKFLNRGICTSEADVTNNLEHYCQVQFIEILDARYRSQFEHFVISMLRPELND